MHGYTGKMLMVDLTHQTAEPREIPPAWIEAFLGGEGVAMRLFYDLVRPQADPLDPAQPLIFATGPLTGTTAPCSGRCNVVFYSPATGTLGAANAGGHFAPALKKAGWDLLVITGQAAEPTYLVIVDDKVEFRSAAGLWGQGIRETEEGIRAEVNEKGLQIAAIGPAGEQLVRFASIMTDKHRAFGRGGPGAAMGAKRLKAIAIRGTQPLPLADPEALKQAAAAAREELFAEAAEFFLISLCVSALNSLFSRENRMVRTLWRWSWLGLLVLLAACGRASSPSQPPQRLILATTTSTQDSGLLDSLLPDFKARTGIDVQVVAVGSGQAMEMGQNGDADVLLVHSPSAEEQFVNDGYGVDRTAVMHNDYVIVGPAADPAGIKGLTNAVEAFQQIAGTRSTFISRGDDSGTHNKEKSLWVKAAITPTAEGGWYVSAGQGMGAVLGMAEEMDGYTLSDRGTYLARVNEGYSLPILVEGDPLLFNPYHVIAVNPAKYPGINYDGAKLFIEWIVAPETQARIAAFTDPKSGKPLFYPDAVPVNGK